MYFVLNASYSDKFAFKPAAGQKSMMLCKLLAGDCIEMAGNTQESKNLKFPPSNQSTGRRYDTVTGTTQRSKVFIVYENGRAYPEYLVTYNDPEYGGGQSQSLIDEAIAAVAKDRNAALDALYEQKPGTPNMPIAPKAGTSAPTPQSNDASVRQSVRQTVSLFTERGSTEGVEEMIKSGNIRVPDQHGALPLHIAVANVCNIELISALVSAYPEARSMRDGFGRTPLELVRPGRYFGSNEIT